MSTETPRKTGDPETNRSTSKPVIFKYVGHVSSLGGGRGRNMLEQRKDFSTSQSSDDFLFSKKLSFHLLQVADLSGKSYVPKC
jgi:hypothetical protein